MSKMALVTGAGSGIGQGCDLDFLVGNRGAAVPKDNH